MRRGEAGQGGAEFAGLLAVVALVVAAMNAGGTGGAIAYGAERAVCAIVGDGCEQAERAQPQVQRLTGEPAPPPLAGGEIAALPFPGSVSMTGRGMAVVRLFARACARAGAPGGSATGGWPRGVLS